MDQIFKETGRTNLGIYYIEYKKEKERKALEQQREALSAKLSGSLLPDDIKRELVKDEVDNRYHMYENRQMEDRPAQPNMINNMNRMPSLNSMPIRVEQSSQNMINPMNQRQDQKFAMGNQIHSQPQQQNQQLPQVKEQPRRVPLTASYVAKLKASGQLSQGVQQFASTYPNQGMNRQMYQNQGGQNLQRQEPPRLQTPNRQYLSHSPMRGDGPNMSKHPSQTHMNPKPFNYHDKIASNFRGDKFSDGSDEFFKP